MLKKFFQFALLAFAVFFVVSNPVGAASTARAIGNGLAVAATAVGNFLAAVTA